MIGNIHSLKGLVPKYFYKIIFTGKDKGDYYLEHLFYKIKPKHVDTKDYFEVMMKQLYGVKSVIKP